MPRSEAESVQEVDDIPTLHDLYASGDLTPPPAEDLEFKIDEVLNKRVSIWRGDITTLKAGMIVNAANSSLLGGGGVDGAIHRAAGRELLAECRTLGGAETGETKVTKAYNLPSTYIAHTVGPIYNARDPDLSEEELESCYLTSLHHCRDKKAESIGFSSISTGIYGYPIEDATGVALEQTRLFLEKDDTVKRVIYVVFSAKDERVYRALAPIYFPAAAAAPPAPPTTEIAAEPADDAAPEPPSSQPTIVDESAAAKSAEEAAVEKELKEVPQEEGTEPSKVDEAEVAMGETPAPGGETEAPTPAGPASSPPKRTREP